MSATVAIATSTLGAKSETFVKRHIDTLSEGRTVVICRRVENKTTTDHPVLVIGGSGDSPAEKAGSLIHAVWNQFYWGGIALPGKRVYEAIIRFLSENNVSTVLAEFGPLGCIMQRSAFKAGIPLYVYFRGRDASSLLARKGVRRAYQRLFPQVEGVIAVSRFLLDNLQRLGLSHPNSHVIPSGVNTEVFTPGQKDPDQLLAVGRFVRKKAPDLVIHAFARVARKYPVRLDMIGSGPLLNPCKILAESLGVADRVSFLGSQPHEVVRDRMSSAFILLQHSVTDSGGDAEGLPSVVQEAMSAGAVIISTNHAGIPEAIDSGGNGFLVDEQDLDGFVNAIEHVIDNHEIAIKLSRQARKDAMERFDSRNLARRLERIILGDL